MLSIHKDPCHTWIYGIAWNAHVCSNCCSKHHMAWNKCHSSKVLGHVGRKYCKHHLAPGMSTKHNFILFEKILQKLCHHQKVFYKSAKLKWFHIKIITISSQFESFLKQSTKKNVHWDKSSSTSSHKEFSWHSKEAKTKTEQQDEMREIISALKVESSQTWFLTFGDSNKNKLVFCFQLCFGLLVKWGY